MSFWEWVAVACAVAGGLGSVVAAVIDYRRAQR